jgi:hypothetical protein
MSIRVTDMAHAGLYRLTLNRIVLQ